MSSNEQPTNPKITPCRFLSLPPELRNRIYALVLGGKMMAVSPYYSPEDSTTMHHPVLRAYFLPLNYCDLESTRDRHPLSLTQVCRDIRTETEALPFALNRIVQLCNEPQRIFGPEAKENAEEAARYGPLYGLLDRLSVVQRHAIRSIELDGALTRYVYRRLMPQSTSSTTDTFDVDESADGAAPSWPRNWNQQEVDLPGLEKLVLQVDDAALTLFPFFVNRFFWEQELQGAMKFLRRGELSKEECWGRYGLDKTNILGLTTFGNWAESYVLALNI
ncbi:hypothetical protein DM02DRAFT_676761 [Periconia macrospinosa]|uniref:Uncharacterized protein n=1 Tax=Periconia macrospinosa TaxID=97972 RepID=A0A2V1D6B4_9PLEO|nr:hypothetical protein DM02DRAFT_676761 [Periconia macrospinosa]